jgi:hypothetical protein
LAQSTNPNLMKGIGHVPTHRTVPRNTPPNHGNHHHCVAYADETPAVGCNCGDLFTGPDCIEQIAAHIAGLTEQLTLPFLAPQDVATVDAARAAVDRAQGNALAARRFIEADELGRLGAQLVDLLERNATAYRAGQS